MSKEPVLDPQFAAFVEPLAAMPPMESRTIEESRALWDVSGFGDPAPVAEVREVAIPVKGGAITARLYRPSDAPSGIIVYYHGGGWALGSLESHDVPLRALANSTGAAVLSVDYRLAPEHPFPTGLEDCYAALCWAAEHSAELAGAGKPLIVGGDSAGGNLAAAVALAARDRGGPRLAAQLLLYPALDWRCETKSFEERGGPGFLTGRDMKWYWSTYAADPQQRRQPLASPAQAESHRDLAPAIVVVAEFDPLRDEGLTYAEQLRAADNEVTLLHYETLPHGFFNFLYVVEAAGSAFNEIAGRLSQVLAKGVA